ncbi:MAG: hypothetical protein ABL886_13725 [Rhodoglobus sp.]
MSVIKRGAFGAAVLLAVTACPAKPTADLKKQPPSTLDKQAVGAIAGLVMSGVGCYRELRDQFGAAICSGVVLDEGPSPCIEVEDVLRDGGNQELRFGSGCTGPSIVSGHTGFSLYFIEENGRGNTVICDGAPISHLPKWTEAQVDCYRAIGRVP